MSSARVRRLVLSTCALLLVSTPAVVGVDLAAAHERTHQIKRPNKAAVSSARLRHDIAAERLRRAGISWRSSGGCADWRLPRCTSFEGIRRKVVERLVRFRRVSHCRVVVTGGTENGHADGALSHRQGYKVDILRSRCIDRYVPRHFSAVGKRSDGAALYRSRSGDLFARESSHWDVRCG